MALALPDGPRGRALAVAIGLIGLAAIWQAVAQPLLDAYAAGEDELRQRRALAGRMSDLADTLPALKRAQAQQTTDVTPASAILEGASDALAAASLQGLVETMANGAGAHITSTEALPAEVVGAYRRISLRLTVDASWPVLVRLLQSIDRATPRMFVDEMQIHAQPAADKLKEPPLDISFNVLAFRSASATASAPDAKPSAPARPIAEGDAP